MSFLKMTSRASNFQTRPAAGDGDGGERGGGLGGSLSGGRHWETLGSGPVGPAGPSTMPKGTAW